MIKTTLKVILALWVYLMLLFLGTPYQYAVVISVIFSGVLFFNPFDYHQKQTHVSEQVNNKTKKNLEKMRDLHEMNTKEKKKFLEEQRKKELKKEPKK